MTCLGPVDKRRIKTSRKTKILKMQTWPTVFVFLKSSEGEAAFQLTK